MSACALTGPPCRGRWREQRTLDPIGEGEARSSWFRLLERQPPLRGCRLQVRRVKAVERITRRRAQLKRRPDGTSCGADPRASSGASWKMLGCGCCGFGPAASHEKLLAAEVGREATTEANSGDPSCRDFQGPVLQIHRRASEKTSSTPTSAARAARRKPMLICLKHVARTPHHDDGSLLQIRFSPPVPISACRVFAIPRAKPSERCMGISSHGPKDLAPAEMASEVEWPGAVQYPYI